MKVPGSVQPGDALLLHWAANNNNGTVTPPSGWTKVTGTDRDGVRGGVWLRTAKAGDAGSAVTIKTSDRAKSDVGVTAYRDAHEAPIDAWKAAVQTTPGSSHQAPAVTPSHAGSWVVTYAAAKSSVDNSLKVPAGLTGRRASTGTGGGRITAVLADSAAPVEAGVAQGPFTFEGTAQAGRAVMYSLVLRTGAPEPQPAPKMLVGANYSTLRRWTSPTTSTRRSPASTTKAATGSMSAASLAAPPSRRPGPPATDRSRSPTRTATSPTSARGSTRSSPIPAPPRSTRSS